MQLPPFQNSPSVFFKRLNQGGVLNIKSQGHTSTL